ncbi:MAG: hypothetical protein ACE5K3_08045 [bacterium]
MAIILQKNAEIWGWMRVKSFVEVAVSKVAEKYNFMKILEPSQERSATTKLKRELKSIPSETIESAYEELIAKFFDVMSAFTW